MEATITTNSTVSANGTNGKSLHAAASLPVYSPEVYEYEPQHLDTSHALNRYRRLKAQHPGAIVRIENRGCGHYDVRVYSTENEKQVFYRTMLAQIMETIWNALK